MDILGIINARIAASCIDALVFITETGGAEEVA
jgi:hypothetical protein